MMSTPISTFLPLLRTAGLVILCFATTHLMAAEKPIRVLVWDEQQPEQKQAYGDKFLGETIAAHLATLPGITVTSVGLGSPEQGLDEATLDKTDVIVWWAHKRTRDLEDARAERVVERVKAGKLGMVALHSAHWAKPFVRLMQERAKADALAALTPQQRAAATWTYTYQEPFGDLVKADTPLTPAVEHTGDQWRLALPRCIFPAWRTDGQPSHVTTLLPNHPIAHGLPATWDIAQTEMYGDPFHVPKPDAIIFSEHWDKGGDFSTSGSVWQVGKGRVFYFRPGHETYPIYLSPLPLLVIDNAVHWVAAHAP